MPNLICDMCDCVHNDYETRACTREQINTSFFFTDGDDYECFESYDADKEYQEEFWKRIRRDESTYKQKAKGKRIEIDGVTLYTTDRLPPKSLWMDELTPSVFCTEAITGMGLHLRHALICLDSVKRAIKETRPVSELPEWKGETE